MAGIIKFQKSELSFFFPSKMQHVVFVWARSAGESSLQLVLSWEVARMAWFQVLSSSELFSYPCKPDG